MKAKIKSIYTLTIIATIGILILQVLWLYRQYDYTLTQECEQVSSKIYNLMEEYRDSRGYLQKPDKDIRRHIVTSIQNDSTPSQTGYIKIEIKYIEFARAILSEMDDLVADRLIRQSDLDDNEIQRNGGDVIRHKYSVDSTILKSKLMTGIDDAIIEYQSPLLITKIDSIFNKANLQVSCSLISMDKECWEPIYEIHKAFGMPSLRIIYPYSPLDKKAIEFIYAIPVADVLRPMFAILSISVILSILLILCLIRQIVTIQEYAKLDIIRNNFVHTMIHELKRPISTLKFCVSALDNPKLTSDVTKRNQIVSNTRNAINNLSTYFSRLRDITFNEASQIPLNVNSHRCIGIIEDAIKEVTIPNGKTVNINTECNDNLVIVCDKLHITQILDNLIENAIKYSPDTVNITVACHLDNGQFYISVADDGYGISEDDQKRIFEKFYRSQKAMRSSALGVGLGLTYVKLLTEAHGGSVRVESQENTGTRFTIIIPQE